MCDPMSSEKEGPPAKRTRLDMSPPRSPSVVEISLSEGTKKEPVDVEDVETEEEHCSICLQPIADRTVVPTCSHEFCFECLLIWTEQSRRCPLCSQAIGDYLIHNIRSKYDYQKHYLAPLRASPRLSGIAGTARQDARRRAQSRREREWGRRQRRVQEEADELETAIEKRRWVYRHHLYAKHVASNPYTRYKPFPTPAQFAASSELVSRATVFLRRELRVWVGLDVEFLTTFTLSLMKSLDIRSEPAVRLLAEFLDMDSGGERVNAEHFAHELYSYLRSPYRDLAIYDTVVQYDTPEGVPSPYVPERSSRWVSRSHSHSRSRSRSRPRELSHRRLPSRSPEHAASSSRSPTRRPPSAPRARHAFPGTQGRESGRSANDVASTSREPSATGRDSGRPQPVQRSERRDDAESRKTADLSSGLRRLNHGNSENTSGPQDRQEKASAFARREDVNRSRTGGTHTSRRDDSATGAENAGTASSSTSPSFANSQAPDAARILDLSSGREIIGAAQVPEAIPSRGAAHGVGPSNNDERVRAERKRPATRVRNRNLSESVQAHLSIRGASSKQRDVVAGDKHGRAVASDVPSLLLRLSDPTPPHTARPSASASEIASHDANAVVTEEKLASAARDSVPRIATPQTSTDTTLLAQQRGSESESTRSATADPGMEHTAGIASAASTASTASTDLRAILLSKLAREKRIISIPTASHDNLSQPCNGRSLSVERASDVLEPGDGDVARHVRSDAAGPSKGPSTEIDDAEARLRSRTQLRVRLAAQKKLASISGDLPDENDIHHADHSSRTHAGIVERLAMAKEDLLRRRLQERREGSHP